MYSSPAMTRALRRLGRLLWLRGGRPQFQDLIRNLDQTLPWTDALTTALVAACAPVRYDFMNYQYPVSVGDVVAHRVLLLHASLEVIVLDWSDRGCCRRKPAAVVEYALAHGGPGFRDDADAKMRLTVLEDVAFELFSLPETPVPIVEPLSAAISSHGVRRMTDGPVVTVTFATGEEHVIYAPASIVEKEKKDKGDSL